MAESTTHDFMLGSKVYDGARDSHKKDTNNLYKDNPSMIKFDESVR